MQMKKFVALIPLVVLIGGLVGAVVATTDPANGGGSGAVQSGDEQTSGLSSGDSASGLDGLDVNIEDMILGLVPQDVRDYAYAHEGMSFKQLIALWRLNHRTPPADDREPPGTVSIIKELKQKKKQIAGAEDPPRKKQDQDGGQVLADRDPQEVTGAVIDGAGDILPGDDAGILPGDDTDILPGDGSGSSGSGLGSGGMGGKPPLS